MACAVTARTSVANRRCRIEGGVGTMRCGVRAVMPMQGRAVITVSVIANAFAALRDGFADFQNRQLASGAYPASACPASKRMRTSRLSRPRRLMTKQGLGSRADSCRGRFRIGATHRRQQKFAHTISSGPR